jgi:predicted amidohydrolase
LHSNNSGIKTKVKIGLLEIKIESEESAENRIDRILEMLEGVQDRYFDLLILPELWISGAFDYKSNAEFSQSILQKVFMNISRIAAQKNTYIHGGSYPLKKSDGKRYNSALIFNNFGELICEYGKMHLFGFKDGERTVFEPGRRIVVTNILGRKMGISTCYDLRFPELYVNQIELGAEVLIISAAWPTKRIDHWASLLQARAIESQAFVIGCNAKGWSMNIELGGRSSVFSPAGEKLSPIHSNGFLEFEIDLDIVTLIRAEFPVLQDRVQNAPFKRSS